MESERRSVKRGSAEVVVEVICSRVRCAGAERWEGGDGRGLVGEKEEGENDEEFLIAFPSLRSSEKD